MEKKFFCIRGYMKSGTNWVCRILNCHNTIDCVGEFHWESFFTALHNNSSRIAPKRKDNYLSTVRPNLELMIQNSLLQFADPDAKWIGDRTPTTLEPLILQGAPYVVMIRDIRDVLVSRMFHLYNHPRVTTVFDQYPEMKTRLMNFQEDPWYFKEHPTQLLDNEEIVRTSAAEWASFLKRDQLTQQNQSQLKVKNTRYEDLHSDFLPTARSLFEFLGCTPPEKFPNRVLPGLATESPNQLNRKGIVGDWENYMDDKCLAWIRQEAGDEMEKWGYR